MEKASVTYLDHTGAALYPESLVRRDARRLQASLLGNPHSEHAPSRTATRDVESARRAILEFLHADPAEYAVILTANASGGCRLVGEGFPFAAGGHLVLTADNHNSVNGIREYARVRGASVAVVVLDAELRLVDPLRALDTKGRGRSLLAFPAQSNFSGVRHSLELIAAAQEHGYRVLLDAAAFVPTADLRLDQVHPDFVTLSLYKITGYPTGIGALVARHDALSELRRPSFAGGTVRWVSVQHSQHRLLPGAEAHEDGTLSFLAVGAVADALEITQAAGRLRLPAHLQCLTSDLLHGLGALQHRNGAPMVTVHGPTEMQSRGATVALSVHGANGATIPFWDVETLARDSGIAVRGGCFCNPGCAERALAFHPEQTARCREQLGDDFTIPRFADCLDGRAVGAIRISLGLGSIRADVNAAVEFFGSFAEREAQTPVSRRRKPRKASIVP